MGKEKKINGKRSSAGVWKRANGTVVIVDGEIQNNPFAQPHRSSKAVQWMIQNRDVVEKRMEAFLRQNPVQGGDFRDCFDFGLEYFMIRDSRIFRKNFHGEGTEYGVNHYVMRNIKNIVDAYRSKLDGKLSVAPLINRDEALMHAGQIEDKTCCNETLFDAPEDVLMFNDMSYWDSKFSDVMGWFNWFVNSRKYVSFPTEGFVYYMFLINRYEDEKSQLLSTASICGMSKELAEHVHDSLKKAVKKSEDGSRTFMCGVFELISPVKHGWRPPFIRNGEMPNVE